MKCGYGWDAAWNIVTRTIAYTNHTVMAGSVGVLGIELFKRRLPRIYQIIEEINRRFCAQMHEKRNRRLSGRTHGLPTNVTDFVKNGQFGSGGASFCKTVFSIAYSNILKETVFKDF